MNFPSARPFTRERWRDAERELPSLAKTFFISPKLFFWSITGLLSSLPYVCDNINLVSACVSTFYTNFSRRIFFIIFDSILIICMAYYTHSIQAREQSTYVAIQSILRICLCYYNKLQFSQHVLFGASVNS